MKYIYISNLCTKREIKQNIILREYDILEGGNHRIDNVYILQYWRKDTLQKHGNVSQRMLWLTYM